MFLLTFTILCVKTLHCSEERQGLDKVGYGKYKELREVNHSCNGSKFATKSSSEQFKLFPTKLRSQKVRKFDAIKSNNKKRNRTASNQRKLENPDEDTERQLYGNETDMEWVEFEKKAREDGFLLTQPEENPSAVHLNIPGTKCSGTLLTLEWVLTAAHCLSDTYISRKSKVTVCAGGLSYKHCKLKQPGTQIQYSSIYKIHDKYKSNMVDLAVLKTDEKFQRTKTVTPISLSTVEWEFAKLKICKMTAFGQVRKFRESVKDYLRKTHHMFVTNPCPCFKSVFWSSMMCNMPQEDFGACRGDSGAGLVCKGDLVGVLKGGMRWKDYSRCEEGDIKQVDKSECGSKNTVSTFVQVYPERGWIYKHIPELQPRTALVQVAMKSGASTNLVLSYWLTCCISVYILNSIVVCW